ncbi:MAG: thioredoxin [Gammaproteobacteria bacterium]|nr:thioredoxin [Gammaproteobacteria bacterium]
MAVIELTKENIEETIVSNDIVLIDFWAPWCGPCKSFAPIYEEVADKNEGVVFAKVNTEDEQELAAHFQIRSIPTLMIFREQIVLYSEAGMLPAPALQEIVDKVKSLDMEQVKKDVEAEQQQA